MAHSLQIFLQGPASHDLSNEDYFVLLLVMPSFYKVYDVRMLQLLHQYDLVVNLLPL